MRGSRDGFCRYKHLYANGGAEALCEISKKKPIMKNHVPAYVKKAVVDLAIENPAQGQLRAFRNLNNVVRLFPVAGCVHLVTLRSGNNEETLEGCDSQASMMGGIMGHIWR